ncbi:MAG: efflux RND transporter permease subunit [Microgenomates group bacterium]
MVSVEKKSYLERIQFDPGLWKSWIAKYVVNMRIVMLLVVSILAIGVFGYLNLPRRLNPEIKIPIVTIVTILPGASPQDVESLVTIPIENKLRSVKGIDTLSSTSRDNASIITMQFLSTVSPDKAKADVQSQVDSITDLPDDAKVPTVAAIDFEDQPVWTFVISTKKDIRSLMSFSKELQNRIEDNAKVDRVTTTGFETQEIDVSILPEKLREYGVNPLLLAQNLQKGILAYPAGSVQTARNMFSLAIDPQVTSISDIRNIRLSVSGKTIRLGDIAVVRERSVRSQSPSFLATNTAPSSRAVTMYVYKTTTSNIDEASRAIHAVVEEAVKEYGNTFTITTVMNTAEEIDTQFTDLLGEFRSTILLIIGCLFIFLGLRQALISSFSVPLTFLSAFFFMNLFGQSINFLTLFAFLIALGLLIDDTIVVVSAMTSYYKTGKFTPAETGLIVWRDTIVPIWSTTITTIWSFVPLLLSTGIIGEFIKPIPLVVTITMLSSTAIAVLITLPFMIVILKPTIAHRVVVLIKVLTFIIFLFVVRSIIGTSPLLPIITVVYILFAWIVGRTYGEVTKTVGHIVKKNTFLSSISGLMKRFSDHGVINIEPLAAAYSRLILRILNSASARKKVIIAIVTYSVVAFSLVPLGLVKNEFFPKTDQETIYVNALFPSGATTENVIKETKHILETLRHTKQTLFVAAEVGQQLGSSGGRSSISNAAVFTIHLTPEEKRSQKSMDIAQELRTRLATYQKGTLSVVEESSGPPAGADLQIKLTGDDLGVLDSYADTIVAHLKKQPGVANAEKSIRPGTSKLVFVPDYGILAENGLTIDSVGLWMRMYASGFTLDSVNFEKSTSSTKKDIIFHMTDDTATPSELGALQIPTVTGASIPLSSLGSFVVKSNPTVITRENHTRTLSVSASVLPGYSATVMGKELETFADSLNLPSGYSWKTGGANEENQKSITSIVQSMAVAFILILVTMVLQFQSYRQALIVLLVIPLAVSSVFVVFALTGTPISFPALIGILSLFGIVVTNSMFIVDKININLEEGMPFKEAIADAGASRLEPIILTKLNTILGLLPITLSNPLWRGLGGAIISGILLASFIMLLFIPAVYYNWFRAEEEKMDLTK